MPNPFLQNVDFEVTKSVSVQNRRDEAGNVATYILLKPGVGSNFQLRKSGLSDDNAELVLKIGQSFISNLTASLSSALAASTATGSW